MGLRICFCRPTVNRLTEAWRRALRRGDRRVVQRATALLLLAEQVPVPTVAARVGAGVSTVYAWLQTFVVAQFASLVYRTSRGRPAKLTPTQKQRLYTLVAAGPEAAGYATGCWNSAVVQDLIRRQFGVLYSVQYVAELLRNLGFSYQKALCWPKSPSARGTRRSPLAIEPLSSRGGAGASRARMEAGLAFRPTQSGE